ncbi:MAG: DUF2017 family protein [Verrucomicrobia bacterium]|nr:DUF2017 family protein [Verrucomicrobiota bacterium]
MRLLCSPKNAVLSASPTEARWFARILRALIDHYRIPPDELDAQTANAWYSTRGCATARMSANDTREWLQNLRQFRSARLPLLERCESRLRSPQPGRSASLPLTRAEASELVTALNDHRLALAAQHDIGETEMGSSLEQWLDLPRPKHQALADIHLLAHLVEQLLHCIAPEAADWPRAAT